MTAGIADVQSFTGECIGTHVARLAGGIKAPVLTWSTLIAVAIGMTMVVTRQAMAVLSVEG